MRELIEELGEVIEAGEWVEDGKDHYHSSGKVRIHVSETRHEVQMKDKQTWVTVESKDTLKAAKMVARSKLHGD